MDKLMVDSRGEVTISNDGATIMKLLDIVHPAAKTLVDIARSQDAEVLYTLTNASWSLADHNLGGRWYYKCSLTCW